MSLTPMDEPKGDHTGALPEVEDDPGLVQRFRLRARGFLRSLPGGNRLLSWGDDRGGDRPQSRVHIDGLADRAVEPPECPRIGDLPRRDRPFTYPTRNHSERNRVDLVCVEMDDRLTVSLPENPDATLTSDTWERVEP
ncbi:hypothetical protein [Haloarcula sp. JP-L23]|uniref:hypothetical protein n=1 Tax=Haloarcula sp. JP-L23 TaxID=2716717 RepID=UPI001D0370EA